MHRSRILVLSLALALFMTACGGGAAVSNAGLSEESNPSASILATQEAADQEIAADETAGMEAGATVATGIEGNADHPENGMDESSGVVDGEVLADGEGTIAEEEAMVDEMASQFSPAYFSADLVDASTGESFKIEDHIGKVVLLETLAMWCSNCFRQQSEVKILHETLGERADFISIGLDIDPNENIADLKGYVEDNQFDWLYAVAPLDVARELGQLYSAQFLNPPSTPMLIIDQQGNVHTLPFGIKSADQLLESLEPFLDEG